MSLMLHAGAERATIAEVRSVVTPDPDESWVPVAHGDLIDIVLGSFTDNGWRVREAAHGLYRDGKRYFGFFEVENGEERPDYRKMIGIRNSHDKSFAVGLAMGSRVFVCDNLCFSGDVILGRMHTKNVVRDLPQLVSRGVAELNILGETQDRRFDAYRAHDLTAADADHILWMSTEREVVPYTKLRKVRAEWLKPQHEEFSGRNVWSLFNCFTEVMKLQNRRELLKRSGALIGLCDQVVGISEKFEHTVSAN